MSWAVVFRRQASGDVDEIVDWYEGRRKGLGGYFYDSLKQTVTDIALRPLSFPQVYKGARRALMPRFPYAIYFVVEGERIEVFAVVHGHRRPGVWRKRV